MHITLTCLIKRGKIMFLLKDLFEQYDIECQYWLEYELLEDNWKDSTYSFKDNVHAWRVKNSFQGLEITFDGVEYHFKSYNDGLLMYNRVTT